MNTIFTPHLIAILSGALISALVAIVVLLFTNMGNNRRQKQQHDHELRLSNRDNLRNKIEAVYLSFSLWETGFSSIYVSFIGFVKGEMSERDAMDMFNNQDHIQNGSKEKVEMLLALYFGHLLPTYEEVMKAREDIVKFFPPNKPPVASGQEYYKAQKDFEAKAEKFKLTIANEIEKL